MRIDVVGKHMEVTDAIREYAESKAERILKFFNGTQQITFLVEQMKHNEFATEVVVDVVKHEDFVSSARSDNLYASIDTAVDKVQRQLKDFKEKLRLH